MTLSLAGSVYYSEHKYILDGIKHAQLLTFDGVSHACVCLSLASRRTQTLMQLFSARSWYDYYDLPFWTSLFNRVLADQDVASLVPPAHAHQAKL